jgi:hypothetical protein
MHSPAPPDSTTPDIELFCPGCGYSLRGIASDKCPECGLAIDRTEASVSRIPWEHRSRIGYIRAYWRTLWMPATSVARDVIRPVNYRDARLFQLITVLIAGLPIAALSLLPLPAYLYTGMASSLTSWPVVLPAGWAIDLMLPMVAGVGLKFAVPIAVLLFLLAMTGVPSYFFHPPHLSVVQQNRAIALSYYACTPIVMLLLPALAAWAGVIASVTGLAWLNDDVTAKFFAGMIMGFGPPVILLVLLIGYVRMLRSATACTPSRVLAMVVMLPIAWAALAALILVGLPWVVGYVMMIAWSLQ